jgi:hypothetical protein
MAKWTNTFLVGIYKVELTYSEKRGLRAEWSPAVPTRDLSDQEWEQYRSGRDALLAEVAKHVGGSVLVVER